MLETGILQRLMQPLIKSVEQTSEYYFEEGCFITELSNSTDDHELSIARARVEPGATTKLHCLKGVIERYVIISGVGCVEVGKEVPRSVNIGDVVIIPAMCSQKITNTGKGDLIFLAICTPRFSKKCYQDLSDSLEQ